MLKRIFLAILLLFTSYVPAHSAEIVNVEYVHSLIKKVWNIDVPYYEDSLKYAANMEYVLKAVDKANEILNGTPTTDYGNSEYATLYAADTVATIDAVNRLIEKQNKSSFFITTTPTTSSFDIMISAAGEYTIDWGDGKTETITKTDTTMTPYSHTYDKAGEYTIGLGGKATDYNDAEIDSSQEGSEELAMMSAAISFGGNTNIADISGSLGEIFSTLPDGSQPRFAATFMMTSITSIPENLFSGIQGAPTDFMFVMTFMMTPITSIPAGLFADIQGAPAVGMFASTFFGCRWLTGSIPVGFFSGIKGTPAMGMFAQTFAGCSGLTGSIPASLFAGISGAHADSMFSGTFAGCSGLTGSIPADLFAGISGAPASGMFYNTFDGCSGLTGEIPAGLFGELSGAPAEEMFAGTFSGCSGLTGEIPAGLFSGIRGVPAQNMFYNTFDSCSGLTGEIPAGLFGELSGAPAEYMFYRTFYGCKNLTGEIPAGLFGELSGAPAGYMFAYTFSGCSGLTGEIPAGLFGELSGAPAECMFDGTFSGCSGLTSIPAGLFGELSGAPAEEMFALTFSGCSGLAGEIPLGLFGELSNSVNALMFWATFSGCAGLTGPSARMPDGTYLYDYFAEGGSFDMYSGATGLDDYPCIPTEWGGAGGVCAPKSSFFITTTPTTSSFDIMISAAGEYTIDWGDGKTETITKTDTNMTPYSHTYDTAGEYTIGLGGKATDYNDAEIDITQEGSEELMMMSAAISFAGNTNIANISGSLGEIFSTLPDGSQPRFAATFMMTSITSIPENLFSGVQGAPKDFMFAMTFVGTPITSIPENLFSGIQGAPANGMFYGTFGMTPITSIPDGLFDGISGAPAEMMFAATFTGCTNLSGEIPLGLFGELSGAPAEMMFMMTFSECSGLTGPSARQPDGTYLYDYFDTATITQVGDMYTGATGLEDYPCIPELWGGAGGVCGGSTDPIEPVEASFYITTTPDTSSFSFQISAAGEYTIDWGDGKTEKITKSDTTMTPYSHTYDKAGQYFIGLDGKATDYSELETEENQSIDFMELMMSAAISFAENTNIAKISGSLGEIFSTLPDGRQPRFAATFMETSLVSIPENLFSGVQGAPASYMFYSTFDGCSGLTGEIPAGLFAGIQGAPAERMFQSTFDGCSGLTGIPADLFAGIQGAPAEGMFGATFRNCSNLSGEIPLGLFGELSGVPAENMFYDTFSGCSKLTGPSARQPDGTYLYDYFDTATSSYVDDMYRGATGLSDYSSIPAAWK